MPDEPEADRRRLRGCDAEAPASATHRRCPWSQLTGGESVVIGWWRLWRRLGVWPYAGGTDEQPAWIVQAFDVLTAADDARKEAER